MAGSIFDTRPQDVDASMLAAASTTPDAHAKVINMSARLGVKPDIVARNPQWAERQLNQIIDSQALVNTHPATAKYLSDSNNASVSRDDIIAQMAMEDTLRNAELLEPGLFGKDVRDALVKQMRDKGRDVQFVDTPSDWFKGSRPAEFSGYGMDDFGRPVEVGGNRRRQWSHRNLAQPNCLQNQWGSLNGWLPGWLRVSLFRLLQRSRR